MDVSDYISSEDSDTEEQPPVQESAFVARPYQVELFEIAKKKNSILVLGTGSGKTFISILLIKEFGEQIRGLVSDGFKRTVFVVNTVPLVHQQHKAICDHTAFKVGKYEGSMDVDLWNEEKWKEEINDNEVLVMSAQILVDLILHARLRIRDINLIIMDECHHATGKHPMREIMRAYNEEDKTYRPRVVSLTACIIHKRVAVNKIGKGMEDLEKVMDSTLETATDQVLVEQYTTRPEEVIIGYSNTVNEDCQGVQDITRYENLLQEIRGKEGNDIESNALKGIDAKEVKALKKIVRNIRDAQLTLGRWCGMQALEYEMENIKAKAEREDNPAMVFELHKLCDNLRVLYDDICSSPVGHSNPKEFITPKVKRLLEVLVSCREADLHCLVFVKQRSTAKILYDLLLKMKEYESKLEYIKPAYVVGSNNSLDIDLAQLELKKQKETLAKFRKGEFNIVVSTSVLEEGVDVRICNVVIRFDPPETFRSYVQSRGRARDSPSRYIFLVREEDINEMKNAIAIYREMEAHLKAKCHDRLHPNEEDILKDFKSDEILPPYAPYGPSGPKVTMISALGLINKYCQTLPQDKFTKLAPEYKFIKISRNNGTVYFKCSLKLPLSSLLKEVVWSRPQEHKDLAKRNVALIACQRLHENGELNMNLLPVPLRDEGLFQDLIDIPDEALPTGRSKAGTRKCRQVYEKALCSAYKDLSSYFLYAIHIHHSKKNPDGPTVSSSHTSSHLGLLVSEPICLSAFPLYSDKFGEVVVTFECLNEHYEVNSLTLQSIKNFHRLIYEMLLGLPDDLFAFKDDRLPLLILPLREYSIDLELLHEVAVPHSLKPERPKDSDRQRYVFHEHMFQDAVIIPWYDSKREIYVVTKILDHLNPCSEFPESKETYKTFKDYYRKKYNIEIYNDKQFLLEAKHAPRGLSLFKPVSVKSKKLNKKPAYVPELCWIAPFKASLLWQIILLPSILHRSNMLNLCHEIGDQVIPGSLCSLYDMEILNYDWPKHEIEKVMAYGQNFCAALNCRESVPLHPLMILNALTLTSACDAFDMEQLEILGDSFLKFFCGQRIFLGDSSVHEGRLTQKRSFLVSNKSLYAQAWKKGIPMLIQGTKFVPVENAFPHGFQVKQVYEEQLLERRVPANQWHAVKIQDGRIVQDAVGPVDDQKHEDCYNPWTQHQVADKSVADVVEALIGVYLLTGGPKRAIEFLKWIELPVPEDEEMPEDALITQSDENRRYIKKMYKKLCFDRLERALHYHFQEQSFLVQALTHPSYMANRATESYQRLEFLGDAVLDYVITGHIYSKFQAYSPGNITDLRSHMVNNETLAKVAIKHNLQKYLLHMAPKLQFSIDTFIELVESGETNLNWENEAHVFEDVEVPKALGDIVESLIGAVYLDCKGDLQRTWEFIHHLMGDFLVDNVEEIPINCVREVYELDSNAKFTKTSQDDEEPEITLTVCDKIFVGRGKNKRVAKMAAAKIALKYLKVPASYIPC